MSPFSIFFTIVKRKTPAVARVSSRNKDSRLSDEFSQQPPSSRAEDSSSALPASSISVDHSTDATSNDITTRCATDRSTTVNNSSSASALIPAVLSTQQSTTVEIGKRYNNRLSILSRKSSKNCSVTNSTVIKAAISMLQTEEIKMLMQDISVNIDLKMQ